MKPNSIWSKAVMKVPGSWPKALKETLIVYLLFFWTFGLLAVLVTRSTNMEKWAVTALPLAIGLVWACVVACVLRRARPHNSSRVIAIAIFSLFVFCLGSLIPEYFEKRVLSEHSNDVLDFKNNSPKFQEMDRVARRFGKILVVAPAESTYPMTRKASIYGSSPVAVVSFQDICELWVSPSELKASYKSAPAKIQDFTDLALMIHEVGHCVDIGRDGGALKGVAGHTHSIAPIDIPAVTDARSYYYVATTASSTIKWREAYADIFTVGYFRLTYPSIATQFASWFATEREISIFDKVHQTQCWIKLARDAEGPNTLDDLPKWADQIRDNHSCR